MTMDYTSNSRRDRENPEKPKKDIRPVVTSDVIVRKKGLGRKVKDLFIEADLKSVMRYVIYDVFFPDARNMVYDALSEGLKRAMFKDREVIRRRSIFGVPGQQRFTYNNPISRAAPQPLRAHPRTTRMRNSTDDFILVSREEAATALDQLNNILDQYEVVSLFDVKVTLELDASPIDNKWGWLDLSDARIVQVREGFLLDLPPAEPIQ